MRTLAFIFRFALLFTFAQMPLAATFAALAQGRRDAGPPASPQAENDPLVASAPLWDANNDGIYTCDEWKQYAARLFGMADRNRDGFIDLSEFKTIQQAFPPFKDADLGYFDENGDRRLSRAEFVNKPNPLFARYDNNNDCKVTQNELKMRSMSTPPPGSRRPGGAKGGPGGGMGGPRF